MNTLTVVRSLVLTLAFVLPASSAFADRAFIYSTNDLAEMAATVVSARVVALADIPGTKPETVPNKRATLKVLETLRGKLKVGATITMDYWFRFQRPTPLHLKRDATHVFFLAPRGPKETHYRPLERHDSAPLDSPKLRNEISAALADPCCTWQSHPKRPGLAAILLPTKRTYARGEEVNFRLFLRNATSKPMPFTSTSHPRASMTWTELVITDKKTGKRVTGKPVPWLTKASSDKYFSRQKPWKESLSIHTMRPTYLQRVTTAKTGWGFKERLGFLYYPLKPGTYHFAARLHRFITGIAVVETQPVEIAIH